MQLGPEGQRLTRVLVDFDICLEFERGDSIALGDFSIDGPKTPASPPNNVGYATIAQGLSLALQMIGATCVSAEVNESGDLSVVFADGTAISSPHSDGEAWEFSGSNGGRVISGPTGDLSIWTT